MDSSPAVEKSPFDKKEYKAITLDNGIRALLITDNRTSSRGPKRKKSEIHDSDAEPEEDSEDEDEDDSDEESEGGEGVDGGETERRSADQGKSLRSACGVCIRTGSYCDPPQVQGLAHLLEHMVFMGSEKYPGENTFDAFTSKHGGFDNASTDYEKTVFQFSVHPQYFQEGLDMFAHFFASPSLLKQSLDREIEAVDNEFQTAVQNDGDRLERLIASVARPGHSFTNFVWGNRDSLKKQPRKNGVDLHKALNTYYKRHYSSHYMTVVVMSCYPLDTLEQWTRQSFSAVPHNGLEVPLMSDNKDVFDEATFARLYKVIPVKDTHKLRLTWALPPLMEHYGSKPVEYLSWLLGHEGEGSVYAELKKRNLATALVAGNSGSGYEWNTAFSLFTCDITLTDQGLESIFLCITLVFQYIKMLTEVGPQERVFREIQGISKNEFDFREEQEPIDFVEALCESMELYPVEHYLTGDYLLYEYEPATITTVLSHFTPDRVNIITLSPTYTAQCRLKERWFGTRYCVEDIPADWKTKWQNLELHPDLHLPSPNLFIATDFSTGDPGSPPTKYPVVIKECPKYKLWYKKGVEDCPLAWVCLIFKTPLSIQSENSNLMHIFLNIYGRNMTAVAYNASVAQLEHSLEVFNSGVALTINGFNHKMGLLFQELVKYLADFATDEETFKTAKEQRRKSLKNQLLKPKKLCKINRLKVLEYCHWTTQEKLDALDHLTLAALMEFVDQFKRQLFVEALVQGNITPKEALSMMTFLTEHIDYDPLPSDVQAKIKPRTMQLPSNTNVCYRLDNKNTNSTCTVLTDYYQCCQRTTRDAAILELLSECMNEPCFNELRTKQQLGYEVRIEEHNTHGVLGLSLTLVTHATKFSDDYASGCMNKFVHDFHSELTAWTPKQFQDQVDSLIQEKREPDISLEDEVLRNWTEVLLCDYDYDILERLATELESVSQKEVLDWLHRYTHPGRHYRKLSVKVVSGCKRSQVSRANSSEEVTRSKASTPTAMLPNICLQCSTEYLNLASGESSVDPPTTEGIRAALVRVCEDAPCDGCEGVESFKAGLFVHPSQSHDQLTI
ncbi:nardilysin-like isoform X2 [Halichondria panicea]|uniref:nardilysin-like isoform X2 n=1 Tax=Halichondria panicea TaxID=6063 RepID=UPI00312BB545